MSSRTALRHVVRRPAFESPRTQFANSAIQNIRWSSEFRITNKDPHPGDGPSQAIRTRHRFEKPLLRDGGATVYPPNGSSRIRNLALGLQHQWHNFGREVLLDQRPQNVLNFIQPFGTEVIRGLTTKYFPHFFGDVIDRSAGVNQCSKTAAGQRDIFRVALALANFFGMFQLTRYPEPSKANRSDRTDRLNPGRRVKSGDDNSGRRQEPSQRRDARKNHQSIESKEARQNQQAYKHARAHNFFFHLSLHPSEGIVNLPRTSPDLPVHVAVGCLLGLQRYNRSPLQHRSFKGLELSSFDQHSGADRIYAQRKFLLRAGSNAVVAGPDAARG